MRTMKTLRKILLGLLVAYLVLGLLALFGQRRLQYHPDTSPMNPAVAGLPGAQQQTISTADGERIVTWWIAPKRGDTPVYLYLHGNGSNLHSRAARFGRLAEAGAGLLAVSWRGYGGSSGSPSEEGLHADARAGYAELARRVDPKRIVIYGESLGTTVAVMLAAEVKSAALVLDSGFASALDIGERRYPFLPVRWFMRDPLRADLSAPSVAVPVFQVHCADDPVTPIDSARQLHALLPRAQPIVVLDGRCHVPSLLRYEQPLQAFVAAVFRPS
jgi:pimeloyl-ACP methyl ester carboxylesterase